MLPRSLPLCKLSLTYRPRMVEGVRGKILATPDLSSEEASLTVVGLGQNTIRVCVVKRLRGRWSAMKDSPLGQVNHAQSVG
jgi:hypothetical protein